MQMMISARVLRAWSSEKEQFNQAELAALETLILTEPMVVAH
jgi:hypothetical protein